MLETRRRHGKYLLVRLSSGDWLVLRFGMTGSVQALQVYARSGSAHYLLENGPRRINEYERMTAMAGLAKTSSHPLQVDWSFEGCDTVDERHIEQHWQSLQAGFEGKLTELADPPAHLRVAVEHSDTVPQWQLAAALHIPSTTLVAETEHDVLEQGLEDLVAILANRIDLLRDEPKAVTQRREGLEAVSALLQFWRKRGRSDAFLSFLTPTVLSLRPYVERELEVREMEGSLTGMRLSPLEILDQVLVDAWEFFQRKNGLPLDLWLIRLADQAIARLGKSLADSSLDEQFAATDTEPRAFQRADWDEWTEQVSYRETEALAELIGGAPAIDAWDDLSLGERQTYLSGLLGRLPWEQRQALLLFTVYGSNLTEIADFQGRTLSNVQSDIDEAVMILKQKPTRDRKRSD